jgi:small subunit ribosomal protein S20
MAAGAIPPPRFFELGRPVAAIASATAARRRSEQPAASITCESTMAHLKSSGRRAYPRLNKRAVTAEGFETMANTTSAKKATRKIARRTVINKSRRTEMRGAVRTVEEAIKRGDRDAALKAMTRAEPELMRAAQRNIVHKNNASRKVSRLSHQIAKLAK